MKQIVMMAVLILGCTGGAKVQSDTEFAVAGQKLGLPQVVAYQWVCDSLHKGQDFAPGSVIPPGRKQSSSFTSRKAYLALQDGKFYADFTGAFARREQDSKPEIWQKQGEVGMPEFTRYTKMPQERSVFHVLYIHSDLPEGRFDGRFYGFLKSGDRSGQETFQCKSEVWWPIMPTGW